jgi:hypothetical protein
MEVRSGKTSVLASEEEHEPKIMRGLGYQHMDTK